MTKVEIRSSSIEHSVGPCLSGAEALFVGRVRDLNDDQTVVALMYEAYPMMAERVMKDIAKEAENEFCLSSCTILHRVGRLTPGEVALLVSVESTHRKEAFAASSYVVDELKKRAPIWKKEFYDDGTSRWLKPHAKKG